MQSGMPLPPRLVRTLIMIQVVFGAAVMGALAPRVDYPLLLPMDFQSPAQALRVWKPMKGSPPVQPGRVGSLPALRFACPFHRKTMDRASWDREIRLDLRLARGVRFWFRCRNADPIAYFALYFHSGNGWYAANFSPKADDSWERIDISKGKASAEDAPAGWGRIDAVRISAWRGGATDTAFEITGFGLLPADRDYLVIRGPGRNAGRYCRNVLNALERSGLNPVAVNQSEVDAALLRSVKLALLPYNPKMPGELVARLLRFVARGGRVIGFYSAPPRLIRALGIQPGKYASAAGIPGGLGWIRFVRGALPGAPPAVRQNSWNLAVVAPVSGRSRVLAFWYTPAGKNTRYAAIVGGRRGLWMSHVYLAQDPRAGARMLLAMVGRYLPGVWDRAAAQAIARVGSFPPYTGYEDALRALTPRARASAAIDSYLRRAVTAMARARRNRAQRAWGPAIQAAETADSALREAFYRALEPLPGEFRGAWCHRPYGIKGWTWDKTVRRFAAAGFNAIFPNMLWGGTASYPSRVLPVSPAVRKNGDQIAACLRACRRYGVQMHVWKVCFNLGPHPDPAFLRRLTREGRLQKNRFGRSGRRKWLCPSDPRNQRLEIDSLLEIVRNYPVDGIHFDYIRYPGADFCYCNGCRKRFERFAGVRIRHWPADVLKNGPYHAQWLAFRRHNITTIVRAVHDGAKKIRPGVKISAAVFSNWLSCRDSLGQDWVAWCRKGYLDFVCPMDYIASDFQFGRTVRRQLAWVRGFGTPLYPGIGLSTARFGAPGLISQILITRKQRTGGFMVFEYNRREATDILPKLALGLTRP